MKILLTGASGFFGRSFYEQYGSQHFVSAPSHKELNLLDASSVSAYLSAEYFDAVLHLAGSDAPIKNVEQAENLIMFKNIQHSVIRNRISRLITVGSGAEYDSSRNLSNVIEEEVGFNVPDDAHGVISYFINLLASKDKVTTNLRHFTVFGRYSSPYTNTIAKLAYHAIMGNDITLVRDRLVSLIYIDDSLRIINAAVNGEIPKNDYNVASGKFKLSQIAKMMRELTGINFEVNVLEREKLPEYTADTHRLMSVLPKFKFTPIRKGLSDLLDYMQDSYEDFNEKKIRETLNKH